MSSWQGKMIGGSIGSFFGPWGAVAGATAGHFLVDRKASSPKKQAQRLIAVTAAALYELAQTDGRYTTREDRAIRTILAELNQAVGGVLAPQDLAYLIDDCARIDRPLVRLAAMVRDAPGLAHASAVWLWRVAVSDGDATPAKADCIAGYARSAGIHDDDLRTAALLYVRHSASAQERRDACNVLGIPYNADEAQIKSAYRTLSLTYHPDKHSGLDPAIQALTTEKFTQIKNAYDTLNGRPSDNWFARNAATGHLAIATAGAAVRCFTCGERATLPQESRQIDSARCDRCQTLLAFEHDLAVHLST